MPRANEKTISERKGVSSGLKSKNETDLSTGTKKKKRYRFKPGTVIRRQIRKLQRTTNLLVPAAPFVRVVREIADTFALNGIRFESKALEGLHIAAEDFLTEQFKDAEKNMHMVTNGKRQTLNPSVLRSTIQMKYGSAV